MTDTYDFTAREKREWAGADVATSYARAYPVLEAVGFAEARKQTVAACWHVTDPGAPFDFFRDGTARGGALLRPQTPETAAAIRAAVVEKVRENHGDGSQWTIPLPAVVFRQSPLRCPFG